MTQSPAQQNEITSWSQFTEFVRSKGCNLLKRLDDFPEAVLVTGCQRSGTTIMSRVITQSKGMVSYQVGPDDELDAALILSGYMDHNPGGRYCFQTTYLDECYREYYEHDVNYKIVWVLRNPFSVIYSLLYNWRPVSLDGTFMKCAGNKLTGMQRWSYRLLGLRAVNRTRRACYLYKAKTEQLLELFEVLGKEKIFIVDYDDLVLNKERILPQIYDFIELEYQPDYSQLIHSKSVDKKSKLSNKEKQEIDSIATPVYMEASSIRKRHMP